MVNIFAIPVFHRPEGKITSAIVGGNTRSGLAETLIRSGIFRAIGKTGPIVTIQSVALQPVAITSAARGIAPEAGSTDTVLSLSDQPITRATATATAQRRY